MVFEKLGSSLRDTLSKVAKSMFVDEKLINELTKDIQRALLQADVNVRLVFDLTKKIKERITKEETPAGLTKNEFLINIVYEELATFLGGEPRPLKITKKPFKIMLVGLFGSGKTTTTGKLSKFLQKRGHKVAVIQTDTWRPAAYEQLQQLSKQVNVDMFGIKGEKDPEKIYKKYEEELNSYDVVIVDTAGRDALSDELFDELNKINALVKPDDVLLVISGDIGQAAEKQAQAFHDSCNVKGVIITKLDGTAKGGGALTACEVTGAHVRFIGVGEKVDDLEEFKPKNFVGRLLGMGDIEALLEKAKEAISEEDAQDMGKKFLSGKFNLVDLYEQMETMSKMGSLGKIMEMVPGMSQLKLPKDMLQTQEGKLENWKYMMNSCTKGELEDPDSIDSSRIDRIAKGSGRTVKEVRELLKQYKQSKKMVKMMGGAGANEKSMDKMMKKMQKGGGMPGMGGMKFK